MKGKKYPLEKRETEKFLEKIDFLGKKLIDLFIRS